MPKDNFLRSVLVGMAAVLLATYQVAASSLLTPAKIVRLGVQLPSQIVTRKLTVKNAALQPLRLTLLKTSCGCLYAKVSPKTVMAGGTAVLSLRIITHSLPGSATVTALLSGKRGGRGVATEYIVSYTVEPMVRFSWGGGRYSSSPILDLGRVKQTSLGKPFIINVRRGGFPAVWDTLRCKCTNPDLVVATRRMGRRHWAVRVVFAHRHLFGTQSFPLRFSFLNHGKELAYHLTEPLEVDVTGYLSLVPSSLLMGLVKPDATYRASIGLWSRDGSVKPLFLRAVSTTPKQLQIKLVKGGKAVLVTFTPGKLRGPVSGSFSFVVRYGSNKVKIHEDYFAYILKRHGEPIPRQQIPR